MSANDKQIAGNHYKKNGIQPWDYVVANNIGYLEGSAIKYITRWKDKNGIDDIRKAIHFLEKLIEVQPERLERSNSAPSFVEQCADISRVQQPHRFDGAEARLYQLGAISPGHWSPNLNTEAILRPDNV
jgi:hypothetical protein